MTNPRKRPLLAVGSSKTSNKYGSSTARSVSKKRALGARPLQLASVARMESLLDTATKKKKKKSKLGKPSADKMNGLLPRSGRGSTDDHVRRSSKTTATGRKRLSNENIQNEARRDNSHNRWSHVDSKSKQKRRAGVVNPFLEIKKEKKAQTRKTSNAPATDDTKSTKRKKNSADLFLSSKKEGEITETERPRNSFESQTTGIHGTNSLIGDVTTFGKAIPSANFAENTSIDTPSDNPNVNHALDPHFKDNNSSTRNSFQPQPSVMPTPKDTNPNQVGDKGTKPSPEKLLPTQEKADRTTTLERKSSNSSFRPKLGLKLSNNKPRRDKTALASGRIFASSIVTSSLPTESHQAPVPDMEKEYREEGLLKVLSSPGNSNPSDTLNHNEIPPTGAISNNHAKSSEESATIEDENVVEVPGGLDAPSKMNNTAKNNKKETKPSKASNKINDNFVRLNMKNKAGSCRGAKNKNSKFHKEKRSWSFRGGGVGTTDGRENGAPLGGLAVPTVTFDAPVPSSFRPNATENSETPGEEEDTSRGRFHRSNAFRSSKSNSTSYVSKLSGLDPLDEFVDGTFHHSQSKVPGATKPNLPPSQSTPAAVFGERATAQAPKCARHQRPCKLIKVKKATTGNKGREFYACSMPRGEQCNHFQWADDTVEAARCTIAGNSSYSSFISRQVAAYVDRFRTLTVPELKEETSRRGLNKNGKKQQLLMRLAIWTRDELVKSSPELANAEVESESVTNSKIEIQEDEKSDTDDSSSSTSEDELELFDGDEGSEEEDNADTDDESVTYETSTSRNFSNDCLAEAKDNAVDTGSSLSASLKEIFGHNAFRNGQEWAIQRCLDEKSSLLVAPTGFGKSLCYALPAALMDGVCIVVSPLISLIQDQLRSLPPRIPAATLSGSVSASKTAAILDDIVRKRLKILFVSPERLTSPAFRRLFNLSWNPETKTRERKFPEISLLCIDEAHCISQWAHNFRPCFLRFKGFLKVMKPKSILAITATAGPRVIRDIGQTLGMDFPESITEDSPETSMDTEHEGLKIIRSGRDNIDVMGKFMSNQEERLATVAGILTPFGANSTDKKNPYARRLARGSVIVYVWRQRDTEVVAESLKAAGVAGGIVVYHGGMDANARAKSQSKFMRGKARICVATVAFGLGIDKADIVGIVHLYLSNSPEHYLQEIGRAGRDGRSATAIALPLLEEVPTRHSLAYSNLVAKSQIRSLLRTIRRLVESAGKVCEMNDSNCGRFLHIALPVQSTVRACDCKPETIETFLSLIERIGGENPLLQIEGYNYDGATIALKKRTLKKLAEREPVAISIQAVSQCVEIPLSEVGADTQTTVSTSGLPSSFQRQFVAYSKGSHSFSISQCANRLGPTAEPRHVFAALRRLQSSNELEFVLDTSERGRIFQLKISETGFGVFQSKEYGAMEEHLVNTIFESFSSSSDSGATKFLDMHYILDQVAESSSNSSLDSDGASADGSVPEKSLGLVRFQELTERYFGKGLESERLAAEGLLPASFSKIRDKELKIDALSLLRDLPPLFQQQQTNNGNNGTASKANPPEHLKLGDKADYTALAITKFLHGMDTPRTPFWTFRQYPLFGKWKTVDFCLVHDFICNVLETRSQTIEEKVWHINTA